MSRHGPSVERRVPTLLMQGSVTIASFPIRVAHVSLAPSDYEYEAERKVRERERERMDQRFSMRPQT